MDYITEGILVKKDGIYRRHWYGGQHEQKVDSFVPYLDKILQLDEDVTFGDFFDHVMGEAYQHSTIFYSQLGGFALEDWIGEWSRPDEYDKDLNDLHYLSVYWIAEIWSHTDKLEDYVDFHAVGAGEYPDTGEKVEDMNYSVSFTPLNNLKHLPFKIFNEYKIIQHTSGTTKEEYILETKKPMTVYDVIGGILNDVSFYGNPEARQEAGDELNRRAKELDDILDEKGLDGALKDGDLLSWEDLEEKLKSTDEANDEPDESQDKE